MLNIMEMLPSTFEIIKKYQPKIQNIERLLDNADIQVAEKLSKIETLLSDLKKDQDILEARWETEGKVQLIAIETDLVEVKKKIQNNKPLHSIPSFLTKNSWYKTFWAGLGAFTGWKFFSLFDAWDDQKGFFENVWHCLSRDLVSEPHQQSVSSSYSDFSLSSHNVSEVCASSIRPSEEESKNSETWWTYEKNSEEESVEAVAVLEKSDSSLWDASEHFSDEHMPDISQWQWEKNPDFTPSESSSLPPQEVVKDLQSQGHTQLYIFTKMSVLWFAPKLVWEWKKSVMAANNLNYLFSGWPLQALGKKRKVFLNNLHFLLTKDKVAFLEQMKQGFDTQHKNLKSFMDQQLSLYKDIEHDLHHGISSKEFVKKYQHAIELGEKKIFSFPSLKNSLRKFFTKTPHSLPKTETNFLTAQNMKDMESKKFHAPLKTLSEKEMKHLRLYAQELDKIHYDTKKQLASLDKKAASSPEHLTRYQKQMKELIQKSSQQMLELKQKTLPLLQDLSPHELKQLQSQYSFIDRIVKNNGWNAEKFLSKFPRTKQGKLIKIAKWTGKFALGGLAFSLLADSTLKVSSGETSVKEVLLQWTDLGVGFIPVLWGVYDAVTAFTGSPITWKQFEGWDKWTRVGLWVTTAVLDGFSFGTLGTALKGVVKWGKPVAKAGKTALTLAKATTWAKVLTKDARVADHSSKAAKMARGLQTGLSLATYSYLGYSLYEQMYEVVLPLSQEIEKQLTPDLILST